MTVIHESAATEFLDFALAAAAAGLSVVPPRMDGSKAPLSSWKSFQHFPPDEAQLRRWYSGTGLTGMGVVAGKVSGNLEILEFDDRLAYESFRSAADAAGLGALVARIEAGYCEASPKPGIHYLYRCSEIAGNAKLATRPKTPEEMKHPKDKEQVLIETRGEGGYIITAPSNGKTHPSGGCYSLLSGGFDSIETITPEERRDLFTLARTFHVTPAAESEKAEKDNVRQHRTQAPVGNSAGWLVRPGDDFNQKAVWAELLEGQGWTFVFRHGERDYWRRPGKHQGISACTNWDGKDYFYCFSSSTEFDALKPLDKFGFHARTMHGGDFKATVKALAEAGYGTPDLTAEKPKKAERPTDSDEDPYRGSDDANADLFLQLHGDNVRFCASWNKWLVWSETHWTIDDRLRIKTLAETIPRELYRMAAQTANHEERKKISALAWTLESTGSRGTMLLAVQHKRVVHHTDLDKPHFLINTATGTVDLRTGAVRSHHRNDLLTSAVDYPYSGNDTAPAWQQFLIDVFAGDRELIEFVQRAVGYSLTGDVREQCLFLVTGNGSNGKSVFLNILRKLLGKLAIQAAPDLLMAAKSERHPTDQADLFSKRLVICQETGDGRRFNETLVKQLTGGDGIRARRMREDFWEFDPTHKLWLSTNHKPEIRGTDFAIWRRIRLIPFNVTFTDDGPARKDPLMEEKLTAELPGILAWAVSGCLKWQQHGSLGTPEAVTSATDSYRQEQDILATWINDCCVVTKLAEVKAADLYASYGAWCEQAGERPEPQRRWGMRLSERGFVRQRRMAGIVYLGVGLVVHAPNERYDQQSGINTNSVKETTFNRDSGSYHSYPTSPPVESSVPTPEPPPLTPPQFTVMAAIKDAGLYGETLTRITAACPRMGGGLVKSVLAELIAADRVVERDGRYAVAEVAL